MSRNEFLIEMAKGNGVKVSDLDEDALQMAQIGVRRGKFQLSTDGKVYSATEAFSSKFKAMYDSLKNKKGQD